VFAELGIGILALEKLSPHMSPAVGELEIRLVSFKRLVGAVAIGHRDTFESIEDLGGRFLGSALQDAIGGDIVGRDAPGPPLARVLVLVVAPEGLVGIDHVVF